MNIRMKRTVKISLKSVGLFSAVLYYIFCYISYDEKIPNFLNSIFLYLFVGLGLINLVKYRLTDLSKEYLKWYLCFFAFAVLGIFVAMLFSMVTRESYDTLFQMVVSFLLCNSLVAFVKDENDLKVIGGAHIAGAVALCALLIISGQLHIDKRLGQSLTGNSNIFATLYMSAALYGIWMFIFATHKKEKICLGLSLAVIAYALLLSGGRKYLIIPVLFGYMLLYLKTDKQGRRHILLCTVGLGILVVALYVLMINIDTLYYTIGSRMKSLINQFTGKGTMDSSDIRRRELRRMGFIEGWKFPLLGHGFDSFKYLAQETFHVLYYSHNNWVEMWYNGGIVGIIIYYSFYCKTLYASWKIKKVNQPVALLGVAGILSVFIFEYGAVDYYLYQVQSFLCLISIFVYRERLRDEQISNNDKINQE